MGGISDVTTPVKLRGTAPLDPATAPQATADPTSVTPDPALGVASDKPPAPSDADSSGLNLGTLVTDGIKALVSSEDPLPPPKHGSSDFDPKNLTAEDQNRFNLIMQVLQMTEDASMASSTGSDVDVTSKAGAVAKKAEPPKHHGGFFGKIMSFVKQILPVLTLITMFVPGLQFLSLALKVAQMAMKAYELIQALQSGDMSKILGSVASLASSFGGPIGQLGELGSKGASMLKDIEEGGLSGGLKAFGDLVGGDVGGMLKTASSAVTAIEKGDLSALADIAGPALHLDDDTMTKLKDAVGVASAVVKKDAGAALASLGDLTGAPGLDTVGSLFDAAKSGDVGQLVGALTTSGLLPDDATKTLEKVLPVVKKVSAALSSGDPGTIVAAFGEALPASELGGIKSLASEAQTAAVDSLLGMGASTTT